MSFLATVVVECLVVANRALSLQCPLLIAVSAQVYVYGPEALLGRAAGGVCCALLAATLLPVTKHTLWMRVIGAWD